MPNGYYDCSPGAEDLFGYWVDHGPDLAAGFEKAADVKSQYHRPEVVSGALR